MKIRIGSRGSALARWQAEHVKARLRALGHARGSTSPNHWRWC
jgi:porphobilinogen deaminase